MRCNNCESNAELMVSNKNEETPYCLGCFYTAFREYKVTHLDTINVIENKSLIKSFLEEV